MQKTFLITLLSLVMAGCSHEQSCHETLLQAERIVNELPDSTIRTLAPFDIDSFQTPQDRALYGLVFTEAIHHIGLNLLSDSLIAQSEDYYRDSVSDKPRLARSLLHHAIVCYSKQHYAKAFRLIKQAEKTTQENDDPALIYELYAVLGDMHDNANDTPATLNYYRRSLNAARRAGNEMWTARSLNNLATTFDNIGQRDSFQHYMQLVKPMLPHLDGQIRATALCNLGSYQLKQGDVRSAKQNLQKALKLAYLDKANMLLATIAINEGDTARAVELWYQTLQAIEPELQIRAYEQLIGHFNRLHDHRISSDLSQRLNRLYKNFYELSDRAGIMGMQEQYERTQIEHRQYHIVISLLGIALLLILVLLTFSYYHRWRMQRYNQIVSDISLQLSDMEKLQQKLSDQQHIDQLQQLMTTEIVARLHTLAQRGQPASEADWATLLDSYRQLSPSFLTMLGAIKNLQPRELNVCLLIRLHFQPSEVATLTLSSPQAVTNLRVRLLQKVFHQSGGAREFDEQIRNC